MEAVVLEMIGTPKKTLSKGRSVCDVCPNKKAGRHNAKLYLERMLL